MTEEGSAPKKVSAGPAAIAEDSETAEGQALQSTEDAVKAKGTASESSVPSAAIEEAETENTEAAEGRARTEESCKASAARARTEASNTAGSNAEASATEAPGAKAYDTEAPSAKVCDTEAPNAEASDTEAPSAKVCDTEAPNAEASDTEAPGAKVCDTEEPDAKVSNAEASDPEGAADTETVKTETASTEEKAGAGEMSALPLSIPEEKASKSKGRFRFRNGLAAPAKKKWKPRIILGVLGIVAVVLIANSAKLINFYHRNFTTPEEYYRWVERKTIKENAETIAEYYVNQFVEFLHSYDKSVSSEIRVELGDAARDMMELAGADLSWFESGAFTFESNNKDSVTQSAMGLEMSGEKLFAMETIMDFKDQAAYMGFPELTKTYIGIDTDQRSFAKNFSYMFGMEPEEYLETLKLLEILYKECPDKKQVEALANKYLELLLNSIDDVKMRTGKTVRADSITQTCTTLELCFDEDDIKDMLTEFLEEMREDEEIEDLLVEIYDLAAGADLDILDYRDGEEFYGAFQDGIDEMLSDIDYDISYSDELEMTVYVDNKGRIIGRAIEFPNSWNEVSFSYVNPHKGSKFGYKGSIVVNGEEVAIIGSGKESGNKFKGNFTLKYEGTSIVNIEVKGFDMGNLKKGYINGEFTVTAASGMGRALDLVSSSSYLSDMQLVIDISMSKSSEKLRMELKEGKDLWGSLAITSKRGNGKKISVPSTKKTIFVDDERDLENWWDTVKWDGFIKKMEKAGLPSGAIDAVEEFREMGADEILDELEDFMWLLMYDLM